MRLPSLLAKVLVATFLILPLPLMGDTVYTYTGNPLDIGNGSSPYTVGDHVSGWFDISAPLAANLNFASIIPISYSFTDGVNLADESLLPNHAIEISTDASGNISDWTMGWELPDGGTILSGSKYRDGGQAPPPSNIIVFNQFDPGTWTESTLVSRSTAPEPSAFALFGLASWAWQVWPVASFSPVRSSDYP
jgi:hypothetical protein